MEEILESLISTKLPNQYEERINIFDKNISKIFSVLEEPQPYFAKHSITNKDTINPIEPSKLTFATQNGVIVGQLHQMINSTMPVSDEENLSFRGSCFLVTAKIAVCCSHQVTEDKNYVIRIIDRNQNQKKLSIKVVQVHKNLFDKNMPGEAKSEDYAFLVLEANQHIEKYLHEPLRNVKFTCFDDIPNKMFEFKATILGYLETRPKQLKGEKGNAKNWQNWNKNNLIQSTGLAIYSKQQGITYEISTEEGFSGAPISMKYQNTIYLVGLHTRGSRFHRKNFGILFNKKFIDQLEKIKEDFALCNKQQNIKANVFPLLNMVKYSQNLKDWLQKLNDSQLLGTILQKIIEKIVQFENAELVLEKLKLQNVLIAQERQDDIQIDFTRLQLRDFVEKGSLDQSNLICLRQLLKEIQNVAKISIVPAERVHLTFTNSFGLQGEEQTNYKIPITTIIKRCLDDSFRTKQIHRSRSVTILSKKINFVKRLQISLRDFVCQQLGYQKFQLFSIQQQQAIEELMIIIAMKNFKINLDCFRQKFRLLHMYSLQKLTISKIVGTYLCKLSSYHKQLQNVIGLIKQLLKSQARRTDSRGRNVSLQDNRQEIIKMAQKAQKSLENLEIFDQSPKLPFLLKDLSLSVFQSEFKQKKLQEINKYYENIFKDLTIDEQSLFNLVKYEYIFYHIYHTKIEKLHHQIQKYCTQYVKQKAAELQPDSWITSRKQLRKQEPHPLKKKQPNIKKTFNIFDMQIFQQMFIDYEHTHNNQTYNISKITAEQENEYRQIINSLVEIQGSQGKSLGTGFFVEDNIICSAKHIFQGITLQKMKKFKIIDRFQDIVGYIQQSLTSSDKYDTIAKDIIFLKVKIYKFEKKEKENLPRTKLLMIDSNSKDESDLVGKSYFALLIGLRSQNNSISLTRSYGQIDIRQNSCNPIIGENHLSGSPIFLRITDKDNEGKLCYRYFVIGIYTGCTVTKNQMGEMSRFRSKCFKIQGSIISNIKFPKLKIYQNSLKSPLKECIISVYRSLDHFLLRIMAQILRLNSNSIYLQRLMVNNLLLSNGYENEILFSKPQIKVHLQVGKQTKQWFTTRKAKLQYTNKCAFQGLINNLINDSCQAIFSPEDPFVKQSILLAEQQKLNNSTSLSEFYLNCFEGKYYFDKTSSTLKPYIGKQQVVPYILQALEYQSKLEMLFRRFPAEYIARINTAFSILKNLDENLEDKMSINKGSFSINSYNNDKNLLRKYEKEKIQQKHFYFLAKKLIKGGIQQIFHRLSNVHTQYLSERAFKEEYQEYHCIFSSYLRHLTHFSSRTYDQLENFTEMEKSTLQCYYQKCKNWALIAQIVDLYDNFDV